MEPATVQEHGRHQSPRSLRKAKIRLSSSVVNEGPALSGGIPAGNVKLPDHQDGSQYPSVRDIS